MKVICPLCDKIDVLDDKSFQAKRLRNRRKHMYLCEDCYKRIESKTKERHATGDFQLYRVKKKSDLI
ncbi:YlaI family protein [Virgibacillus oceani]